MRGLITMRKSAGGKFEMRESPAECGRIGNSAHTHTHTHTCTQTNTHARAHTRARARTHAHRHACTHARTRACVCARVYTQRKQRFSFLEHARTLPVILDHSYGEYLYTRDKLHRNVLTWRSVDYCRSPLF